MRFSKFHRTRKSALREAAQTTARVLSGVAGIVFLMLTAVWIGLSADRIEVSEWQKLLSSSDSPEVLAEAEVALTVVRISIRQDEVALEWSFWIFVVLVALVVGASLLSSLLREQEGDVESSPMH